MEKYWTTKNGVLGTAHLNRHGVVVDFREASCFSFGDDWLTVIPAHGVKGPREIPPDSLSGEHGGFRIKGTPMVTSRVTESDGSISERGHYVASVLGVEIRGSESLLRFVPSEARLASEAERKEKCLAEQARREEAMASINLVTDQEIEDELTSSERDKVRFGSRRAARAIECAIERFVGKKFPGVLLERNIHSLCDKVFMRAEKYLETR